MAAGGAGSIINISSQAATERGKGTVGYSAAYAASNAALDRLTWSLAAEVGKHNIAVNALKPSRVVDTEGMRLWAPEEERRDWVSPGSVVTCAVFLANQDASGVSGTVATDEEYISWHGLKVAGS